MSKVKRPAQKPGAAKSKPKRPATTVPVLEEGGEEVRISSVLFGLILISAIMVAGAAWMGGSLSKIERRAGNFVDATARSMGLAVEYVAVRGLSPQLTEEVREAALIEPGENMFRADPKRIRQRVENTQLVTNVRVHRFWPNHILIMADAVEPIAHWHDGEVWAAVDGLGRRLPQEAVLASFTPVETPVLELALSGNGADRAAPELAALLKGAPWLKDRAERAYRVSNSRWDLELASGLRLMLPEDRRLVQAFQRLKDVHQHTGLLDRPALQVDIRARDRIFVQPLSIAEAELDHNMRGG